MGGHEAAGQHATGEELAPGGGTRPTAARRDDAAGPGPGPRGAPPAAHSGAASGGEGAMSGGRRGARVARLALCLAVLMAGLDSAQAQAQTADTWDSRKTTKANTGHENGRIVRGAGSEATLKVKGTFDFTTCASAAECYRCIFANAQDQSFSVDFALPGTFDSTVAGEIKCNTNSLWGSYYDAAKVELLIQKKTSTTWQTLSQNPNRGKYFVFLEEDIFSVKPSQANAMSQSVTIFGSGFSASKQYSCVSFEGPTSDTWAAQIVAKASRGFTGLQGFDFMVINRTMGICNISTQYAARSTKISIMTRKDAVDTLTTVRDRPENGYQSPQPALLEITKPASGGDDIITWKGLDLTWYESWNFAYRIDSISGVEQIFDMISGLKAGGQGMYFDGAGFKGTTTYYCKYTYNSRANSGCDQIFQREENTYVHAQVAVVEPISSAQRAMGAFGPMRAKCVTPQWTFDQLPLASTIVTLHAGSENGPLVKENGKGSSFEFVTQPQFTANTPNEGTVFVEGVNCASLNLTFAAFGGMSPLRLTLDYTPLRPAAGEDFLSWDDVVPAQEEVLLKTDDRERKYFVDSAKLDDIQTYGYCLGDLTHTLALPNRQLPEKMTSGHVEYNKATHEYERTSDGLGIADNELQPSNLTFATVISGDLVSGELVWNVSRGWEGYGYKLCITARHASSWWELTLTSPNFATRCIYVVVPKCQKCYGPGDNLASIAMGYGSNWLDLWSLNLDLINTTHVNVASDEVFNTQNDQLYPLVAQRQKIRLGIAYLMRKQDTLETLAQRFGMSLRNLMQINPDVVAANQVCCALEHAPVLTNVLRLELPLGSGADTRSCAELRARRQTVVHHSISSAVQSMQSRSGGA
jgi:LysM repeat protein